MQLYPYGQQPSNGILSSILPRLPPMSAISIQFIITLMVVVIAFILARRFMTLTPFEKQSYFYINPYISCKQLQNCLTTSRLPYNIHKHQKELITIRSTFSVLSWYQIMMEYYKVSN